jgi:cholesterol transport system auxiliary component
MTHPPPMHHAQPTGRASGFARWWWLAALLPLLAACAGTLLPKPAPAPARFTLDTGPAATPAPGARVVPADAPTLTVDLPRAAPGYDSRRMVYQRRPQQMEAFAFHEWVEPPAQMLAPLLVRALQDQGGFRAVLRAPSAATGGWRLETELLRLHQDFSQHPSQVRLSVRAVLLNSATRQAVAWREFDVSVAATGDDPVAGAAAAQAAARQLASEVAAFSAERAR